MPYKIEENNRRFVWLRVIQRLDVSESIQEHYSIIFNNLLKGF